MLHSISLLCDCNKLVCAYLFDIILYLNVLWLIMIIIIVGVDGIALEYSRY